jgi:ABC-2 type transport system permease protein
LPTALRVIAEWNPVSALTQATRDLFGNTSPIAPTSDSWPLRHPVITSLVWVVVIMVVFVPLALRQYKKTVSR